MIKAIFAVSCLGALMLVSCASGRTDDGQQGRTTIRGDIIVQFEGVSAERCPVKIRGHDPLTVEFQSVDGETTEFNVPFRRGQALIVGGSGSCAGKGRLDAIIPTSTSYEVTVAGRSIGSITLDEIVKGEDRWQVVVDIVDV